MMTKAFVIRMSLMATVSWLAGCAQSAVESTVAWAERATSGTPPRRVLNVVAHEDDDLLFLNPDLQNDITQGAFVRTVFVTAGPQWFIYPDGTADWRVREDGILSAYAKMANVNVPFSRDLWTASTVPASGYNVRLYTLKSAPNVSVVFLRLAMGIQDLWYGVIPQLGIVNYGDRAEISGYNGNLIVNKFQLVDVLRDLVVGFETSQIRTLDAIELSGHEHPEHVAAARLTVAANALLPTPLPITLYRSYNVVNEAINLPAASIASKTAAFAAYATIDTHEYGGSFVYDSSKADSIEVKSLSRRYNANQLGSPLRFGDINNDGLLDVCARWSDGPHCALRQPTSHQFLRIEAAPYRAVANFSDGNGWDREAYYSSLQLADVSGDGRADLCGRAGAGILCSLSTGAGFSTETYWGSFFTDAQGWNALPSYYGSIRFADLNGDARVDVCGRGAAGIYCALSTGHGFASAALWLPFFTDAQGWGSIQYGTTIVLGDINGDGRADVCGRGAAGIFCARAQVGGGFGEATQVISAFSDAEGWAADSAYYGSLRLVDVNGDGNADLCGRGPSGVRCARATGTGFASPNDLTTDFVHALAWIDPLVGPPVKYTDVYFGDAPTTCALGTYGFTCAGH